MERRERLEKLYERVYSHPRLVSALYILGSVAVVYVILGFVTVVSALVLDGAYLDCAKLLALAAIPFAVVSVMRFILSSDRPYEVIDLAQFEKMRATRKKGKSFPSRHVFSAFLIGVLSFSYSLLLGIIVLALGAFIALSRVLLGIHFVKDVVVGALIGVLSGVIALLIL
jgi:membrane-associated phospholipid phosphatase